MRRYVFCLVLLVLVWGSVASAQTGPCAAAVGTSDTVTTGKAPTVSWKWPATFDDPVYGSVPFRVNGASIEIVTSSGSVVQAKRDYTLPSPTLCSDGQNAYAVTLLSGVQKGSYIARVLGWNYVLDDNGNPTTTRQEGGYATRPFNAVDALMTGAPTAPANLKVVR